MGISTGCKNTVVELDAGINSAMKRLRQALGDSADNPRFLETLVRRGDHWIGPIEDSDTSFPTPHGSQAAASPYRLLYVGSG